MIFYDLHCITFWANAVLLYSQCCNTVIWTIWYIWLSMWYQWQGKVNWSSISSTFTLGDVVIPPQKNGARNTGMLFNSHYLTSFTQTLWYSYRFPTKGIYQCVGLDVGLIAVAVWCLEIGVTYGLNRWRPLGKTALGSRSSDVGDVTEVGLGDPEELGVEEGGGVSCGRWGGPSRLLWMGVCHELVPCDHKLSGIAARCPRYICWECAPLSRSACSSAGV